MADDDNVVLRLVEFPVGLIGNIVRFEDTSALQIERVRKTLGMGLEV
jgi:hypothetical protein